MTPYYQHNGITIYHGDCLDIMPHLEPVDLVLTDPPYGINWNTDYKSWIKKGPNAEGGNGKRSYPKVYGDDKPFDPSFLLEFKVVIVWGAPCFMKHLGNGTLLVWHKRNSEGFLCNAEVAWMNKGMGAYVFKEPVEKMQAERKHPTQKPVNLMKWCINKANCNGTILDPFMGSGTTLVAAQELGRKCIGIEIEEKYCQIAVQRLKQQPLPFTNTVTHDIVKEKQESLLWEESIAKKQKGK